MVRDPHSVQIRDGMGGKELQQSGDGLAGKGCLQMRDGLDGKELAGTAQGAGTSLMWKRCQGNRS